MVRTASVLLMALAAFLIAACTRSLNPCPPGMKVRPSEDRCVAIDDNPIGGDAAVDGGDGDGDDDDDGVDPDRDAEPEPEMDGSVELDGSVETPDAAVPDAGDAAQAEPDAGDGGSDAMLPDECSGADVEAWKAFHVAEGLVAHITSCASDPSCAGTDCSFGECVLAAASVSGCDECVRAEVECVSSECSSECGATGSDDACRACACSKGCTQAFADCSGAAMDDVCADCNESGCQNMSVLPPELIMAVLHPVLFAPQVMMPVTP